MILFKIVEINLFALLHFRHQVSKWSRIFRNKEFTAEFIFLMVLQRQINVQKRSKSYVYRPSLNHKFYMLKQYCNSKSISVKVEFLTHSKVKNANSFK